MKRIKVYNEKGKIKITKIAPYGIEQIMFSDLKDGEVAEIVVDFVPTLQAKKIAIVEAK